MCTDCQLNPNASDIVHVLVVGYVRPMPPKHGTALRVDLHAPRRRHPGTLQPKVEAANAGE